MLMAQTNPQKIEFNNSYAKVSFFNVTWLPVILLFEFQMEMIMLA